MPLVPCLVSNRAHSFRWCEFHGLLIRGQHLDLSAFLVVAWCTFRYLDVLKLSAMVRTITTEVTIYFLAMVALQLYTQLSFVFMVVWPFLPSADTIPRVANQNAPQGIARTNSIA